MAVRKGALSARANQALIVAMGLAVHGMAHAEAVLGEVTVEAREQSEITEGTRSYTTGKSKTATPLSMSLRETPQSVSVVTQQRIEDQDLDTIMDVVNNTTGVSVNRYETNRAQFNARGFEINSLMIDGVPTIWEQPWSSGEVFSSLSMYDRVEVVRGATGLMTGAGDPSAAINLVHKRAASKTLTGSVEVNRGSWHKYGAQADVATGLNQAGTVRARVVGEYADGDSWVKLLSNKRESLYATMDIDLTPNTVLWFGVSSQSDKTDSPMWGGLPVWYGDGSRTKWARSKTASADWARWDSTYDNYFANLEHRFENGWQAKVNYSRGERNADSYLLYLYTYASPGLATFPGSYKTETVQDDFGLQVSGPFRLLGREHELAFGYAHSKQEFKAQSRASSLSGYAGIPDFNSYEGDFPEPTWGPLSFYESSQVTQEGVYGVARFSLADPLKLIVGTRVSNYKKEGRGAAATPEPIEQKHELSPYAGLVYEVSRNVSAYASYTDIFLPQSERSQGAQYLDPIVGSNVEVGLKGEFLDGRLNASAAVFRIEQDGLAKADPNCVRPTCVVTGTANEQAYIESEGATSKGFELDVSGELLPGWSVGAGYTQFTATDAAGDDVNSLYPRKLLRTFTSYRLPGVLNKLTVGGGVNWQDRIYTDAANPSGALERITQKSYSLVNLMARYEFSKQLSAQLNLSNVTDETYFDVFDAYGAQTYGSPRSANVSVKYRF